MKRRGNRIIFGSAIGLATIAVAIDHTRHSLPEPAAVVSGEPSETTDSADVAESPCGAGESPCGMGETPCGAGESPCSL